MASTASSRQKNERLVTPRDLRAIYREIRLAQRRRERQDAHRDGVHPTLRGVSALI